MKKIVISVVILLVGIICLIGGKFAPIEVLASGQLSEPFFFLISIGFLFILIGMVSLIVSLILTFKPKK